MSSGDVCPSVFSEEHLGNLLDILCWFPFMSFAHFFLYDLEGAVVMSNKTEMTEFYSVPMELMGRGFLSISEQMLNQERPLQ